MMALGTVTTPHRFSRLFRFHRLVRAVSLLPNRVSRSVFHCCAFSRLALLRFDTVVLLVPPLLVTPFALSLLPFSRRLVATRQRPGLA